MRVRLGDRMTDSTPTPEEQIAALTAERDELRRDSDANTRMYDEQLQKLTAERDELRAKRDGLKALARDERAYANKMQAERDRYRDALERIAYGCSFPEDGVQRAIRDTARTALTPIEEQHHD